MKEHHYNATITWTGNLGEGTKNYRAYKRHHTTSITGKPDILGSSQPSYQGDADRHNPEDLLLASISTCHMLWYLHLCSVAGITITGYVDRPEGTMLEKDDGSGHFTEVILHPEIIITDPAKIEKAKSLHHDAGKMCFIANSCNFPIKHVPVITGM
ncbi:OsmC family protein [Flavitalea flava]